MSTVQNHWFFRLVEQAARTPAERLVAVFGIAESLVSAPDIRARLVREFPSDHHCLFDARDLDQFLVGSAAAARVGHPAALAQQLAILLQGALAEELRNPETGAMREAAKVAQIVVEKSREKSHWSAGPRMTGWMPAGGMAAALLAALVLWPTAEQAPASAPVMQTVALAPAGMSPDEIEAVLVLHEKIARGICSAPQLLALPQGQVTAYMNVVESRPSDDPAADRRNIREFLTWYDSIRSSECYDPPLNGHTAVNWTKS